MTNCVNCGAPIDKLGFSACPYCGTYNMDITAIDLNQHTPIGIAVKMGNVVITSMCKPEVGSIEVSAETVDCTGRGGAKLYSMDVSHNVGIHIVPDGDGNLFKVVAYNGL